MAEGVIDIPRFEFAWAGSARMPAGSVYGPYTTSYWEFIWGLDGSARVTSGEESFVFGAAVVQLTPPGVRNLYRWQTDSSSAYGYAIFTMETDPGWPRYRPARSGDIVPQLLDHLLWLDTIQPDGWQESATVVLGYALRAFVTGASATRVERDAELPDPIARSLDAVRARWREQGIVPLSLDELATAARVTPAYLCRVYARHVGMSPVASLRWVRLARAAELLSQTNLGIAEVARQVGFDNEFHFSRTFRRSTGLAPSAFRRDPDARLELPSPVARLAAQLRLR